MQTIVFVQLLCCLVFVLDVGDTKAELSTEAGTDASEKQQLVIIIKELEEENAAMVKQMTKEQNELREQMAQTTKNSAKEREELREQMAKEREELLEEIRRGRENKDTKVSKKSKRQFNELRGQLQECKSRETKRLKDAVNPKSANGSLHKNSSRMDACILLSSQLRKPFTKLAKTTTPILQEFKILKTWYESRSFCKKLGGDLATFPITDQLLRARNRKSWPNIYGLWIGGRCQAANDDACHFNVQKKPWKWIGGGEISYDLKYWYNHPNYYPGSYCLSMAGTPEQMLVATSCEYSSYFLCQF